MTKANPSIAILLALVAASCVNVARAQQTPEQLRATHDETVRQLQESQDRKNQLANENEQLKARVGELERRLATIEAQARQAEFLRAQSIAWSAFLQRYPLMLKRFEGYITGGGGPTAQGAVPVAFFDPEWPFSAVVEAESPTTQLTTQPTVATTRPATAPTSAPTTSVAADPTTEPAMAPATQAASQPTTAPTTRPAEGIAQ